MNIPSDLPPAHLRRPQQGSRPAAKCRGPFFISCFLPSGFCQTRCLMPESGMSQSSQNFFRSLDGIGQLFLRMGSRNEHRLKLCRRQSDPLLKHPGKIPGIGLEVASLGVHEGRDGSRREERRTQTLNVVDLNGGSGSVPQPGTLPSRKAACRPRGDP